MGKISEVKTMSFSVASMPMSNINPWDFQRTGDSPNLIEDPQILRIDPLGRPSLKKWGRSLPAPSKGCQMVAKECHFTIP